VRIRPLAIAGVLSATGTGTGINSIVRGEGVLTGWIYLVVCASNFCWEHDSLRVAAPTGDPLEWRERAPAMAAGLTDHRWTMHELLSLPIPLPHGVAPKRRGRPPKQFQAPEPVTA
jgi:hypothetical protein